MSAFNINQIVTTYKLDEKTLAKELFPNNLHPHIAYERISSGKAFLNTKQLEMLAKIVGVQMHELFNSENWTISNRDDNSISFIKGKHRVELIIDKNITNIYCQDKLIAEQTIILDKNIMLKEYLELINTTIINLI